MNCLMIATAVRNRFSISFVLQFSARTQMNLGGCPCSTLRPMSLRSKLIWVAAGYAAVLGASTLLVALRYLQYRWHPDDANQYSGMWAGGAEREKVFKSRVSFGVGHPR